MFSFSRLGSLWVLNVVSLSAELIIFSRFSCVCCVHHVVMVLLGLLGSLQVFNVLLVLQLSAEFFSCSSNLKVFNVVAASTGVVMCSCFFCVCWNLFMLSRLYCACWVLNVSPLSVSLQVLHVLSVPSLPTGLSLGSPCFPASTWFSSSSQLCCCLLWVLYIVLFLLRLLTLLNVSSGFSDVHSENIYKHFCDFFTIINSQFTPVLQPQCKACWDTYPEQ